MSLSQLPLSTGATGQTIEPLLHEVEVGNRRLPRRELVGRVTSFVHDNLKEPVTIAELSRMAGVSERTLRAAFREALGLSPKQYTLAERLRAVRDALRAADPKTTTVTDVAMAYGFFELGRFAGRYRLAFGESPSATLRQTAAAVTAQALRREQAA
jgi:transcriptional regulator GlxA family with amidase domain